MSLYEIAQTKQAFEKSFDLSEIILSIEKLKTRINEVPSMAPGLSDEDRTHMQVLINWFDDLLKQLQIPSGINVQKINKLREEITELSYVLYNNSIVMEENDGGVDNIRKVRNIFLYETVHTEVLQRIRARTSWQYPTLEIGCRDGEWTEHLIAADPLYIMDKHQEFLDSASNKFPEQYQRRLRRYVNNNYDFSALPQNQFGFIFSWNHFNYVSLDTITQVLKKIVNLLRPGGVFMFSYNNGDTPHGVGMSENFGQSYVPKSLLIPTCEFSGLEIISDCTREPGISWLEVKRPGTLTTVKAGQVMGKIERRMP